MTQVDSDRGASAGRGSVATVFHPSIHVPDLAAAEAWYLRVFGVPSVRLSPHPGDPQNRIDYSTFCLVGDLLIDSVDPQLFIKNGLQQYPSVEQPRLQNFGWYAHDVRDLYRQLKDGGVRVVGLLGEEGTDDEPPTAFGSAMPMYFTVPEEVGLRYQFLEPRPMHMDPRTLPGWQLGPPNSADPLGIERTAYHTIVTDQPTRVLKFLRVLGAETVYEGRNALLSSASTFVRLGDGTFEIAQPDEDTSAWEECRRSAPLDSYYSITFKVRDLDRVRRHLAAEGVELQFDTVDVLVTDPRTSHGVPWGFTAQLVPGDDRRPAVDRTP